ncbi:MAG: hypothetical protein CFE43_00265 [Burkholderiales bacterium PBB3]|nr:MAG: hypothetical protein CFE43_00265 [Burkholderiales bacterium PBB3]
MLNRAFNDISPAPLVYANQVGVAGQSVESINAFAILYGNAYGGLSDIALASRALANMGLLPDADLLLGVADYMAANHEARGLVVLQIAQILSISEPDTGPLAKYSKAALAWNIELINSLAYSSEGKYRLSHSTGVQGMEEAAFGEGLTVDIDAPLALVGVNTEVCY